MNSKENINTEQNQIPKRGRGRPRKNQIINDQDKKKNKTPGEIKKLVRTLSEKENEEIILHLPICMSDVTTMKKNNIFEKKETSSQNNSANKNIFTINDINNEFNSDESNSNVDIDNLYVKDLKETMKAQEKRIKKLENEVNEYKTILTETTNQGVNERKVSKMLTDFIFIDSKTGEQHVTEQTNIACWWCTYNFDNVPCFIPEKIQNNKYSVFGCFCSYNCAASYNLDMDDSQTWNRYSLLKKIYNQIFKNNSEIKLAPPREVFEKFGGTVKYEDYKKNCYKLNKEYRFIMPPMTSIVPLIEEGNGDNKLNLKLADLNKKNLILKRNKPLPNHKNSLLETLGISPK